MSTLAQFRTAVRSRVDVSSSDSGLTDAVVNGFINVALKRVSLAADWEWLDAVSTGTLAANDPTIPDPADLGHYQYVMVMTGTQSVYPLVRVTPYDIEKIPLDVRGTPSIWSRGLSGEVAVRPVPDVAYTFHLRYYKTEAVLVADGDTPSLPTAYDDGVVEYAAYLAYRFMHRIPEAREALNFYTEWLKGARDDQTRSRTGFRVRVRSGAWF